MGDRRRHAGRIAAVLALLVAACGGATATLDPTATMTPSGRLTVDPTALPSPAATPTSSPRPTPAPTPGPSEPEQESLPTSASTERDGVRITVKVAANPLYAGSRLGVETTVTNTGRETLHWTVDGCGVDVSATGDLTGAEWRPSSLNVDATLERYRDWLREEAHVDTPIRLQFVPGWLSGMRRYGCADIGIGRSLKPGKSRMDSLVWDGQAAGRLGLPPTSPATITATFDYWHRGNDDEGEDNEPIKVTLDAWVIGGRDPSYLSPAEAIDAALADPEFADWLVVQPFRNGRDAIAEYDRETGLWVIGLIAYREDQDALLHAAFVDPVTGEIVAIREHPVQPF